MCIGDGAPEVCIGDGAPEVCIGDGAPEVCIGDGAPEVCIGDGAPEVCIGDGAPEVCIGDGVHQRCAFEPTTDRTLQAVGSKWNNVFIGKREETRKNPEPCIQIRANNERSSICNPTTLCMIDKL